MERYLDSDLEDIFYKRKTFTEVAEKYGSKPQNVLRAYYRRGFVQRTRRIVVYNLLSNTKTYFFTVVECARSLGVARKTIYSAIKGKKVRLLKTIGVKVEVEHG